MQFHEYSNLHQMCRQRRAHGAARQAAHAWYSQYDQALLGDPILRLQFTAEAHWIADRRPYYNVYPGIVPSLLRLRLDLDCGLIRPPMPTLLVRFTVGQEPVLHNRTLRCLLVASINVRKNRKGMMVLADFGERRNGVAIYSFRTFELSPGRTLEESLADVDYLEIDDNYCADALTDCVRLACTLCLLGDDPEIIEPEPLAADQQQYDDAPDPALIERAVKRGKRAWSVGRRIVVDPHYRRPHVALRWTGEGRSIPRIVPVRGSIVHRSQVAKVPTGYLDDDRCKICGVPVETGKTLCPAHDEERPVAGGEASAITTTTIRQKDRHWKRGKHRSS